MTKITTIIRILWVVTIVSIIFINRSNRILAFGGDSEKVFKISTKQNSVLGYIDGVSSLEPGCGTLINLSEKFSSLSNIKFKNESSKQINFMDFSSNLESHLINNGCDLPNNTLFLNNGAVLYNSSYKISSFQFDVNNSNSYAARFMTITCKVKKQWRKKIPAVVHIDGTARPQIIKRNTNSLYYEILKSYTALSEIPVLINTSFNAHEEPIINRPEECAKALMEQRVDAVVTERAVYILEKT